MGLSPRPGLEASLAGLIDAALEPGEGDRRVVRALLDLGTWDALRDQGLGPVEAAATGSGMLRGWLAAA